MLIRKPVATLGRNSLLQINRIGIFLSIFLMCSTLSAEVQKGKVIHAAIDKEGFMQQENIISDFGDIVLKKSNIGQFDDSIGAFANRDFKKGEEVIKWNLRALSQEEYAKLPKYEKDNFCHHRNGICWLYHDPERHVNRFNHPNVVPDFDKQANIALRDINKGEELSIADNTVEDF